MTPLALDHTPPRDGVDWNRFLPSLLRAGALFLFAAIFVFFAVGSPLFLFPGNLLSIVAQSAILAVLAFALTLVVVTGGDNALAGGIDLSLPATMGLSASVYATLAAGGQPEALSIAASLATGLGVGIVNALSVTRIGMLPLLATLSTMSMATGLEQVITKNATIVVDTSLTAFLGGIDRFGFPVLAYALLVFAVLFIVVTRHTPLGLNLQAVGSNPLAARAAGLNVPLHVGGAYVASGVTGAIGGLFSVAFLGASSNGSGEMLLPVIAATFLGVVFSRRLVPTIAGTLAASLFIGMLTNGFQLLNVSSYWVSGIQGVLTLFVVAATSLRRRA
ncbi:ABC transporter permease [Agrobacterium sp. AGB01]|uniref:ABC transporter permease n=1 Tax=Agrobacterium sp. AGB01 TaxID=2769302 RepID=UPI00178589DE|nr:ABC transporter permease [Agrobacterium sp. AGB01]MBD9388554.1 ABC transporter permease [Agrobacterium sp. AGB01]